MANPFGPTLDVPAGDPAFQRMYLQALMQQQELAYKARVMEAQRPTFGSSLLEGLTKAIPASIGSYVDYLFKRQLLDQQGQQAMAREAAQEQGLMARTRVQQQGLLERLLAEQQAKQAAEAAQRQTLGGALGAFAAGLQPSITETPTGRYEVGPSLGEATTGWEGAAPGMVEPWPTVQPEGMIGGGRTTGRTGLPFDAQLPSDFFEAPAPSGSGSGPIGFPGVYPRREPIERVPVLGPEVTRTVGPPPTSLDAFRGLSDEHRAVLSKALPTGMVERMLDPLAAGKHQAEIQEAKAKALKAEADARVAEATADPKARDARAKAEEAQLKLDEARRRAELLPGLSPDKQEEYLFGLKKPATSERYLTGTATANDYYGSLGLTTPDSKARYLESLTPAQRVQHDRDLRQWLREREQASQSGRELGREGLEQPPAASMDRWRTSTDASRMIGDLQDLAGRVDLAKITGGLRPVFNEMAQTGKYEGIPIPEGLRPQLTTDEMEFLALLADYADNVLRTKSGAQINEQEFRRMLGFLASEQATPDTVRARLALQDRRLDQQIESLETAWRLMGLRPPRVPWRDLKPTLRTPRDPAGLTPAQRQRLDELRRKRGAP